MRNGVGEVEGPVFRRLGAGEVQRGADLEKVDEAYAKLQKAIANKNLEVNKNISSISENIVKEATTEYKDAFKEYSVASAASDDSQRKNFARYLPSEELG